MDSLKTDIDTGIIEVRIAGFLMLDDVALFTQDLRRAATAVAATGKRHRIFCDYSDAVIQSQAVVAALQDLVRDFETPAARIALFTEGRMARLQAARIAAMRDTIRLFDKRFAAMSWLREAPARSAPAPRANAASRTPGEARRQARSG